MPEKKRKAPPSNYDYYVPSNLPIAQDRHFRTPIYVEPLRENVLGEYTSHNTFTPEGAKKAGERGAVKYISLNSIYHPQDDEDLYSKTLKHELAHVLQGRLASKGKNLDVEQSLNPFNKEAWVLPFTNGLMDSYRTLEYAQQLAAKLGIREAPVYTLNRDVQERKDLPQNEIYLEALRRNQIKKLEEMGYGKEAKIWK